MLNMARIFFCDFRTSVFKGWVTDSDFLSAKKIKCTKTNKTTNERETVKCGGLNLGTN